MDLRVRTFLNKLHEQVTFPVETEITPHAQIVFERAGWVFDTYRGDIQVLIDAVKLTVSANCRPYAFASMAVATQMASFQYGDKYDRDGLQEAVHWLEAAQKIAPDRSEIDIIEVSMYLCMKRTADARAVLDHIARDNPDFRGLPKTEMWYWDRAGDHAQWLLWSKRALDLARDDRERFDLLNTAAGYYLNRKMYAEALTAVKKVVRIDRADPWAWHNMSIIHFGLKQYKEASAANETALKLLDFPAAREMQASLKAKRGVLGGWKRA